jgi:hypothetical protein
MVDRSAITRERSVTFRFSRGVLSSYSSTAAAPQRIKVAPVRADHLDPARRRRIDDGGLARRYPGEQVRANPLANQT